MSLPPLTPKALALARTPLSRAYLVIRESTHIEPGEALRILLPLLRSHLLIDGQPEKLARLLVHNGWVRRAIGELLVLTSADYPATWFPEARATRKQKKSGGAMGRPIFSLFDPVRNLDFAIACLWAHPAVRLYKHAGNKAAARCAFLDAWRQLVAADDSGGGVVKPCESAQFRNAVARLWLWPAEIG